MVWMAEGRVARRRRGDRGILVGRGPLRVDRDHDDGASAGAQDAKELAHRRPVVLDMLQNVAANRDVEGVVGEGQGGQIGDSVSVRVEPVDRDIARRLVARERLEYRPFRGYMDDPQTAPVEVQPVPEIEPQKAMSLQRTAARTPRIAPPAQPEGQESRISSIADRTDEDGAAGDGRIGGGPAAGRTVYRPDRGVGPFDVGQSTVQIFEQPDSFASARLFSIREEIQYNPLCQYNPL